MIKQIFISKLAYLSFLLLFLSFIKIYAQNQTPIARYDVATADINTTLNVPSGAPDNYLGLLDNDTDADGDTLTVTQFSTNGGFTWVSAGDTISIAGIGDLTINADGTYTFVPEVGYDGVVPNISYEITDGTDTAISTLYLTVETDQDLMEISSFTTCNQGYTASGKYMIRYFITLKNKSITRGYHKNSEINNIQLFDDLEAIFGDACIFQIDRNTLSTSSPNDFLGGNYPQDWDMASYDTNEFSETDATPGAQGIFNHTTGILYPSQTISLDFCIYIEPGCGGRVIPTASGSGLDFDNIINVTSTKGNVSEHLLLTDFHTPATTVAANFYIPVVSPIVNFDGTYDYENTVIITNDGGAQADNVNYNMGLGNFLDNSVVFIPGDHDNNPATPDVNTPFVMQVDASGNPLATPTVTVNSSYDGDTNTHLLAAGQTIPSGTSIFLKVFHHIAPMSFFGNIAYNNSLMPSMTLGPLDGYDETTPAVKRVASYVIWDTAQGSHSDIYTAAVSASDIASSNDQCECAHPSSMRFVFNVSSYTTKTIVSQEQAPDGILEHKKIVFKIRVGNNVSSNVRLVNLSLTENLLGICGGNIVAISNVGIILPTATDEVPEEAPNLNATFNGTTDTALFDGTLGILNPKEFLDVQFTAIINDDCIGTNSATFSGTDPAGNTISSNGNVPVSVFTDSDNDGISNVNDIDDDNDGIPDLLELVSDPLADADSDLTPDYRDTDFGPDVNGDGIIDVFDFDNDGVPNHFDLDDDNDGIFDIVEAGNSAKDTSHDGRTNFTSVGTNGLDNDLEDNDTAVTTLNYVIPNTDGTTNANFLDIDSDGDGIVDNIEAQTTNAYQAPNGTVSTNGMDTAYPNGLTPVDLDNTITPPDGIPDYIDTDTDDDGFDDNIEAWDTNNDGIANTLPSGFDDDNDGLDNAYDNDDTSVNPSNSGQVPTFFPNEDNDITTERDWRELPAIIVKVTPEVSGTEGNIFDYKIELVRLKNPTLSITSLVDTVISTSTTDGTDTTTTYDVAKTPFDYLYTPSVTTILAGDTEATINIPTNPDTINELEELFTVNYTVTSSNTIDANKTPLTGLFEANVALKSIGKIQDDDAVPDLKMNSDSQDEGVDLSHIIEIDTASNTTTSSSRPIDIVITTTDDTAISPEDYTNSNQTVTINGTDDPTAENTSVAFVIPTIIDNLNEPYKEYLRVVGEVPSTSIGGVNLTDLDKTDTIFDIDPDPTVSISNETTVEGNTLDFKVSLIPKNYEAIDLNIFTNDVSARSPLDYQNIDTKITIPPFVESVTVSISTIDDLLVEDIETFTLQGLVTSFNTINVDTEGTGTIIDNDFPNLFSPNNDGFSDTFEMISLMPYLNFKLFIFDRWGSEVYTYDNKGNPQPQWWDGTKDGDPVPEGVYYYTVDYNDGLTPARSGFVQLIR